MEGRARARLAAHSSRHIPGLTALQTDATNHAPARHRTPGDIMSEYRATSSRNARATSSESASQGLTGWTNLQTQTCSSGRRHEHGRETDYGAVLLFTASPVLAEEVLYCTDTAVVGFVWNDRGEAKSSSFDEQRNTIEVVSETERVITRMTGDIAGSTRKYECSLDSDGTIACQETLSGAWAWRFYRNTCTRAFLAGPPAGKVTDPNIMIAYGTCTKF
jgi:hypothetical protein